MSASRAIRWARWGAAAAVVCIVAAVAARLALLDGWLRTVRIDGASMAPILCGSHLGVTCKGCGIIFRCDAEHLPADGRLVCPNCGLRDIDAGAFPVSAGDTVLVDRWPLLGRGPRRGAVVAYSDPFAGGLAAKRVVGLPGERLSIRGGDLYEGGRIVRKSLAEFREAAVLVHDNDHLPKSLSDAGSRAFLRWKPRSPGSSWEPITAGFRWRAAAEARPEVEWLEYVHFRCDASGTPREQPSPVFDNDAYNQSLARRLNAVTDLLLSCDVAFPPRGRLLLAVSARGRRLQVAIDAETGSIAARQNGLEAAGAVAPRRLAGRNVHIEFGQCDAQLILGIAGKQVLSYPLGESTEGSFDGAASEGPLQIAGAGGTLEITHLTVWRDIYLLEPNGTDRDWEMKSPLGASEFLLLGDNPPVSIDGRHWKSPGLSCGQMRGVVLMPRERGGR